MKGTADGLIQITGSPWKEWSKGWERLEKFAT